MIGSLAVLLSVVGLRLIFDMANLGLLAATPQAKEQLQKYGVRDVVSDISRTGKSLLGKVGLRDDAKNLLDYIKNLMPETENISNRKTLVKNLLSSRFTPKVVASIMGNIEVESGFDPFKKQDPGPGRGLFQMEGKMLKAYNKFLKNEGKNNSASSQIDFVSSALQDDSIYDIGSGHRKELKKSFKDGDVETITRQFSERFLRPGTPHMGRRLKSSENFMGSLATEARELEKRYGQ
jgi:hypothetical protein